LSAISKFYPQEIHLFLFKKPPNVAVGGFFINQKILKKGGKNYDVIPSS
jgi:hypothetical protein